MCTGPHDFIPATNTARVEMTYEMFGQKMQNVLHFQKPSPWGFIDCTTFAEEIITAWDTHLDTMQSDSCYLFSVKVVNIGADDGVGTEVFPASTFHGTRTSPGLPTGTTAAIKFSSLYTGRSRRGRCYHIGLTEDQVTGNQLTVTHQGFLQAAYQNFFDVLSGGDTGATHVVASFCSDGAWRSSALLTPVSFYGVDIDIDSQRRRLSGRGI